MVWYFNNEQAYEYPTNQIIDNLLTQRFHKSLYENSNEMELYYALQYMKENNIQNLSVIFPIKDFSINYGNENDINHEFCTVNNLHYRYENRSGGTMVFFPGNIVTCEIFTTDNFLRQHQFLNDFVNWLKIKNINATTNNNDLLIDNKKVIGAVSETLPEPYNNWVYFGLSISINSNSELINQICTKPMKKIPGALSDYGITTDEVMEWTLDWFDKHQYTEQIN